MTTLEADANLQMRFFVGVQDCSKNLSSTSEEV